MARVSTYLDSAGNTEPAFAFFRPVFGGAFNAPIHRMSEAPAAGGSVQMPLQDMLRGACFGRLRDRCGVQWMVHCRNGSAA